MMRDLGTLRDIRRGLRHAWTPFFTRFGRLTEVQLQTIPHVLAGKNVVVAAPTASGKTEAIVAPVAERMAQHRWEELSVLYVVPTRALANDLLARIEGPLRDMGFSLAIKHGDKPTLAGRSLPNCLVTTPESLDSFLCRSPTFLKTIRAAIIDEVHLLDNTYRGDQLRVLLRRLWALGTSPDSNTYLLSATLASPRAIARRYAPNCQSVVVPGSRDIEFRAVASFADVHRLAREQRWRKILVFCNMRETVERTAARLADMWKPYPVVAHHGSLSAPVRREAEELMKHSDLAVCVATSTLEVGIDIGDIDVIVLAEVPFSVFALLQRAGRGNRRQDRTTLVGVTDIEEEQRVLQEMVDVSRSGMLPAEVYKPEPSVAVQQIFSYLYQRPQGATTDELCEIVSVLCSEEDAERILEHLRDKELLEVHGAKMFLSERVMNWGEHGRIHSNIADSQAYRVVDAGTGKEIGTIVGPFDDTFVLAGMRWKVVGVTKDTVRVRRFAGTARSSSFRRHSNVGAFHYLLPRELKNSWGPVPRGEHF